MGNPWQYNFSVIGRAAAPLLIIHGGDAEAAAKKSGAGFRITGNSDIHGLLPESMRADELNMSKQFRKAAGRPDPALYPLVLNLVSDPDQNPKTLEALRKLLRGYRGRLLNRPEAVLRTGRDHVARQLQGIAGLHVPKVLRLHNPRPGAAPAAVKRAGLQFPLIVRLAGTHTGRIVGVAGDEGQLDAACAGPGTFNLIEFADFRSDDGFYRKYRVFFIGKRRIFRHLIAAESWNVHAKERFAYMKYQPALVAEEGRLLERPGGVFPPGVDAALDAVRDRTPLDYFGVDFGIGDDGRMILFEANPTMNFFPIGIDPPFEHMRAVERPARAAMAALVDPAPAKG